jgi:hypothetical protein
MEYRKGAIGAMTDEYEKALNELKVVLATVSDVAFFYQLHPMTKIANP